MAITLEDLKPAEGATSKTKRVGRGRSSGHGKTSCRGHNGEGQRSGCSSKRGFEGGQMPSYRRLPKLKGFKVINSLKYAELNVSDLEKLSGISRSPSSLQRHSQGMRANMCPLKTPFADSKKSSTEKWMIFRNLRSL